VLKRAGEIKDKHNLDVNLEEDIEEDAEEGAVAESVEDIPEDDKPASANPEVCAANEDEKPFIVFNFGMLFVAFDAVCLCRAMMTARTRLLRSRMKRMAAAWTRPKVVERAKMWEMLWLKQPTRQRMVKAKELSVLRHRQSHRQRNRQRKARRLQEGTRRAGQKRRILRRLLLRKKQREQKIC
jgi:hypothetical protein